MLPVLPAPGDVTCGETPPGTGLKLRVTGFVSPSALCTVTVTAADAPFTGAVVALDDSEIVIGLYMGGLVVIEEPPPPQPLNSSVPQDPKAMSNAVFRDMLDVSFD
jgi:hypothetical protein